jgi:hypothetical protein
MRLLFLTAFVLTLAFVSVADAQVAWVQQSRLEVGLQLPSSQTNPAVLAYRTPIYWPLGASAQSPAEGIFVGNEPEYQYSIPREYFRSEELFRRYYLDNPSGRKPRKSAPPLTDVPTLHRSRSSFETFFTF